MRLKHKLVHLESSNTCNIVLDRVIQGNGPIAVQPEIGNLLSGPLLMKFKQPNESIFNVITSQANIYDLQLFWKLESQEKRTPKDENSISCHLQEYQETFIQFKDGHFSAELPKKDDHPPLSDNYNMAPMTDNHHYFRNMVK